MAPGILLRFFLPVQLNFVRGCDYHTAQLVRAATSVEYEKMKLKRNESTQLV